MLCPQLQAGFGARGRAPSPRQVPTQFPSVDAHGQPRDADAIPPGDGPAALARLLNQTRVLDWRA